MEDLETLKRIAEAIPTATSCHLHPSILSRMASHRQNILLSYDIDLLIDYIDRCTDEECLAVLAEIANHAPLSDNYQALFIHLTRAAFTAVGLEIPTPARLNGGDCGELAPQLGGLLDNLRRDIRKTQRAAVRGACHQ
jgi:hypothetical protein